MPNDIPVKRFSVRCNDCGHIFVEHEQVYFVIQSNNELFCDHCAFDRELFVRQAKAHTAVEYLFRHHDFSCSYRPPNDVARKPLLPCRHPNQGLCGNSFPCQEDCW